MAKKKPSRVARKAILPSVRWDVMQRDGFKCRYCGRGCLDVELTIDHIISVHHGGVDDFFNLITACKECNYGKGRKSAPDVPIQPDQIEGAKKIRDHYQEFCTTCCEVAESQKSQRQAVISLICAAYNVKEFEMVQRDLTYIINLVWEFGPDEVFSWIQSASCRPVRMWKLAAYLNGCRKNYIGKVGEE
jgi:hypothetical protein